MTIYQKSRFHFKQAGVDCTVTSIRIPGLPPEKLKLVQAIARYEQFQKGDKVFSEGDKYRGPFYVVNGSFKIFCTSPAGKESILQVYRKNQILAPAPLFVHENYFFSCAALSDGCLVSFDLQRLKALLQKDAVVCYYFGSITVSALLGFRQKIVDLTLKNAEERLLDYLRLMGAEKKPVSFGIPKNQLALLLDITPESVSRVIMQLKKAGILASTGDKYRILNTAEARQLAPATEN